MKKILLVSGVLLLGSLASAVHQQVPPRDKWHEVRTFLSLAQEKCRMEGHGATTRSILDCVGGEIDLWMKGDPEAIFLRELPKQDD